MSVFGSALHFLRRSIARKLTLTLVGFVAVTLRAPGFYLNRALERFAVDTLEARLASTGRLLRDDAQALLARGAHAAELRAWAVRVARPTRSRVTVIAVDGRVLGDSEVAVEDLPRVENHAGRPEVRAALAGRIGHDLRTSATIDVPLLYVALPIDDSGRVVGVLRLALPLAVVTASYATIHRVMLAGGLVALVVACAIGLFVARRVTSPVVEMQAIARRMSEGDFALRAPVRSPDEIGEPGRALAASERGPAPPRGGRARCRHGAARRHRATPARAGPHRVRGQRLPRAAHPADRGPRVSRDAARGRPRGTGERATVPRDRLPSHRAPRPPPRRPDRPLQHRARQGVAEARPDAARRGRRVGAGDHPPKGRERPRDPR